MPRRTSSPPHTPHGSWRSRAPARQAILAAHPRHMALAVSTSCGDSAKNRSGSSVHGSVNPVRAAGTTALAATGEDIRGGTAPGAPWPLPVPLTPGTDSVSSPTVPGATVVVAGQYMSIPSSRRSCRSGLRRSRGPDKYLRPRTRFGSAAFWGSRPVFLDRIPSRMRTRLVAAVGGDTGHFLVLLAGDLLNGGLHRVMCLRPRPSKDTAGAGGHWDVCGHTGALCARSKRPDTPLAGSLAKKHAVAQCGHLLPQGVVVPPLTWHQPR